MATHTYHEGLPGYHEDQILHDGCDECEARGRNFHMAMANMDRLTFIAAWERAAEWHRHGLPNGSRIELEVLQVLWTVQVMLERVGWPIGQVPAP